MGTFILVTVGAGAVALASRQGGTVLGSALAFGLIIIAVIYAMGMFSGGNYNPAVSFGAAIAGHLGWGRMLAYWIVQLLGAILAGALIAYIFGTANGGGASIGSLTKTDAWKAILLEAILTFFLVFTFLLVAKNVHAAILMGITVGAVLAACMLMGFPLTGASMNPARSFGPALFTGNLSSWWIYLVGPLIGALVAGLVIKLFEMDWRWNCVGDVPKIPEPVTQHGVGSMYPMYTIT